MMMFGGDERMQRFIRLIEQMNSAEMMDMDYRVARLTDDDGSIHYSMEIPDKDVLALVKRPSRILMARPPERPPEHVVEWKALMDRMRDRKPHQEE